MTKDELFFDIGKTLIADRRVASRPWQHLAMIVQFLPSSSSITITGFSYQKDGKVIPTSPRTPELFTKFVQLREKTRQAGNEDWKACLIRIDGASKKMSIDFEYEHPEKWLVQPANVKQMAEALRPLE